MMTTVLTCGAAHALPVGNPSDASLLCEGLFLEGYCGDFCDPCVTWFDAFNMRFGFYGDYVFNRHLEIDEHVDDSDIEKTEIFTNAGFIAANFWNRFDLFTTLGATNIFIDTNNKAFALGGSGRFVIETETDFSWSVGVRATIWECGCTALGAEAQYFFTNPHITRVTDEAENSVYPAHNIHAKYTEWQIGVGISHRVNMFVPYAAVKWTCAKLDFGEAVLTIDGTDAELFNLDSDKFLGYCVGVSLLDCEKASLTVEGRWGDEKAIYTNGQIRF